MYNDIEIVFDKATGYYDAILPSKGIATQGKSLDELIKNINEAMSLSQKHSFVLSKFKLSFEENYVNI